MSALSLCFQQNHNILQKFPAYCIRMFNTKKNRPPREHPSTHYDLFLAHLSQRLIGELIGYSWFVVRPSFTVLKDLLLPNRFANQSQILCGASLGIVNNILFAASGSHDQDGRTPIYGKNPSKIFSRTGRPIFTKLGM